MSEYESVLISHENVRKAKVLVHRTVLRNMNVLRKIGNEKIFLLCFLF